MDLKAEQHALGVAPERSGEARAVGAHGRLVVVGVEAEVERLERARAAPRRAGSRTRPARRAAPPRASGHRLARAIACPEAIQAPAAASSATRSSASRPLASPSSFARSAAARPRPTAGPSGDPGREQVVAGDRAAARRASSRRSRRATPAPMARARASSTTAATARRGDRGRRANPARSRARRSTTGLGPRPPPAPPAGRATTSRPRRALEQLDHGVDQRPGRPAPARTRPHASSSSNPGAGAAPRPAARARRRRGRGRRSPRSVSRRSSSVRGSSSSAEAGARSAPPRRARVGIVDERALVQDPQQPGAQVVDPAVRGRAASPGSASGTASALTVKSRRPRSSVEGRRAHLGQRSRVRVGLRARPGDVDRRRTGGSTTAVSKRSWIRASAPSAAISGAVLAVDHEVEVRRRARPSSASRTAPPTR